MGGWQTNVWSWDFQVEAGEILNNLDAVEEDFDLIELVTEHKPSFEAVDTYNWWPNHNGLLFVKSCYNFLHDKDLGEKSNKNLLSVLKLI